MSTPAAPQSLGRKVWWTGARPKTLGAGTAPVLVGVVLGVAGAHGRSSSAAIAQAGILCLIVALALQVGVNYANDYFDGVRGADRNRVGPLRLTASGIVPAAAVRRAAIISFAIAALIGLYLSLRVDAWLLLVGVAAIASALAYSGGPRPYAGLGLGELFVLAFFGVVPVAGTAYVTLCYSKAACIASSIRPLLQRAWWLGGAMGLFAVCILVTNNIRDIAGDTASGKRTLAVRMGDESSRLLYRICLLLPFVLLSLAVAARTLPVACLAAFGAIAVAIKPMREIGSSRGLGLVPVLVRTGTTEMAFALLFSIALLASR